MSIQFGYIINSDGYTLYEDDISLHDLGLKTLYNLLSSEYNITSPGYEILFIWVDLNVLDFTNKLASLIEQSIFTDGSGNQKIRPLVFIGSQPLVYDDEINSDWAKFNVAFKRIFQLDHSISYYYIHIDKEKIFRNKLIETLNAIKYNYWNGLYDLLVVQEYNDLFKRVVKNNYLDGGHGTQILPYLYTSESIFCAMAQSKQKSIVKKLKKHNISKLKIKVLLLDDFGTKDLTQISGASSCTKINKLKILKRLLSELNNMLDFDIEINQDYSTIVGNFYDVVLLDYNFKSGSDENTSNDIKSGVEVIDKLQKNKLKLDGPFYQSQIIPISSFSKTFRDDIRLSGLNIQGEKYLIHQGADFINSPKVFLYNFLNVIHSLLSRSLKLESNINNLLDKFKEYKKWKKLEADAGIYLKEFNDHFDVEKDLGAMLHAPCGILKCVSDVLIGDDSINFQRKKYYYLQLLFNLANRNYKGNEEIIIYYDLLKSTK